MNDFVLRGFCKKCGGAIHLKQNKVKYLNEIEYGWTPYHHYMKKKHDIEPVWFLSAEQYRLIRNSKQYEDFKMDGIDKGELWLVEDMLGGNPFLVAKILKEAKEKSKEENK